MARVMSSLDRQDLEYETSSSVGRAADLYGEGPSMHRFKPIKLNGGGMNPVTYAWANEIPWTTLNE